MNVCDSKLRVLIGYYSRPGHTEQIANCVAEGALESEEVVVQVKNIADIQAEDLLIAHAIVIGTPVYFGSMSAAVKKFFEVTQFDILAEAKQPMTGIARQIDNVKIDGRLTLRLQPTAGESLISGIELIRVP